MLITLISFPLIFFKKAKNRGYTEEVRMESLQGLNKDRNVKFAVL